MKAAVVMGLLIALMCGAFAVALHQERINLPEPPPLAVHWVKGDTEQIDHRYGELLKAAKRKNWDMIQYQTGTIELSLRLAIQRRPQLESSARPFLEEDLPKVVHAAKQKNEAELAAALTMLHEGCVKCHVKENVAEVNVMVERIKTKAER
jgi:hypothetical protein